MDEVSSKHCCVVVYVSEAQKKAIERAARLERRKVSNYCANAILASLEGRD